MKKEKEILFDEIIETTIDTLRLIQANRATDDIYYLGEDDGVIDYLELQTRILKELAK